LRVSQRELDPELSTDFQPVQSHRKQEKLKAGEIVPVDIRVSQTLVRKFTLWLTYRSSGLTKIDYRANDERSGWKDP